MNNEDYFLTVTYRDRSMAPLVSVSLLSLVSNLCFVKMQGGESMSLLVFVVC